MLAAHVSRPAATVAPPTWRSGAPLLSAESALALHCCCCCGEEGVILLPQLSRPPICLVSRRGLTRLSLPGNSLQDLPPGPYLASELAGRQVAVWKLYRVLLGSAGRLSSNCGRGVDRVGTDVSWLTAE
jgi:hypothetical protein